VVRLRARPTLELPLVAVGLADEAATALAREYCR
jgi:hypothetical protein